MTEPIKLELEGVTYIWNSDDSFQNKEGTVYRYASLKKVTSYQKKGGDKQEKFQVITVKPNHIEEFTNFILECLGGQPEEPGCDSDVPF